MIGVGPADHDLRDAQGCCWEPEYWLMFEPEGVRQETVEQSWKARESVPSPQDPLGGKIILSSTVSTVDFELCGNTRAEISRQAFCHLPTRLLRRNSAHVVADRQRREAASVGRRNPIVGG